MSKVFVGNFSFALDEAALTEYFSKVGEVSSCRIMREGPGGRSRGFGFVEFESQDDAKKAIEELNGSLWEGREIKVSEDRSNRSGGASSASDSSNSGSYQKEERSSAATGYFRAQPLDLGIKKRKKADPFDEDKTIAIDYKRPKVLAKFMSERGRILPRRMTNLSAANQRQVSRAIKRAQHLALLPYRG